MEKRIKQTYYQNTVETETTEEVHIQLDILGLWQIVLHNDEVNTFDWVIECLMKVCNHSKQQAEQCAWFVHYNGKYIVKNGDKETLKPVCESLQEKGLSAVLVKAN